MLRRDCEQRIDGTLLVAAAGVGFHAGFENREGFAEPASHQFRARSIRISGEEPGAALQDGRRPDESGMCELGRVNAILRRQARVQPLGPGPIRQKLERACGHASRDAYGRKHRRFAQAKQF